MFLIHYMFYNLRFLQGIENRQDISGQAYCHKYRSRGLETEGAEPIR